MAKQWTGTALAAVALAGVVAPAAGAKPAKSKPKAARPAVTINAVTAPGGTLAPGARATFAATVRNGGRATRAIAVAFLASRDARKGRGDVALGRASSARLRAGRGGTVKLVARLPKAVTPGTWKLLACATAAGRATCVAAKRAVVVRAATSRPTPAAPTPTVPAPTPHNPSTPPTPPNPETPPTPEPATRALQLASGITWGGYEQRDGDQPEEGETVTTEVRLGAGLPGAAGYARSTLDPQPALSGSETVLFDEATDDLSPDDTSIPVELPFAIPFAGVSLTKVDVSTNGWIGTTASARGYVPPGADDYRGQLAALGANVGAIAPFWSDLTLEGPSFGRIVLVRAADDSAVAIRWQAYSLDESDAGQLTFEAVLFRDGRIRFDYPQRQELAVTDSAIGLSAGTLGSVADLDLADAAPLELPTRSILFTPKTVTTGTAAAGTVTVAIPRGSSFAGGSAGCTQRTAPTSLSAGAIDCAVPALTDAGTTLDVAWTVPFQTFFGVPELAASWTADGSEAGGAEEFAPIELRALSDLRIDSESGSPAPNSYAFGVWLDGPAIGGALRHPRVRATLPAGVTIDRAVIGETELTPAQLSELCGTVPAPGAGGEIACALPNGVPANLPMTFFVTAASAGPVTIGISIDADNLGTVSRAIVLGGG